jgi:hypothetical protein
VTSVPSSASQGITVTAPGGSYTCSSCFIN